MDGSRLSRRARAFSVAALLQLTEETSATDGFCDRSREERDAPASQGDEPEDEPGGAVSIISCSLDTTEGVPRVCAPPHHEHIRASQDTSSLTPEPDPSGRCGRSENTVYLSSAKSSFPPLTYSSRCQCSRGKAPGVTSRSKRRASRSPQPELQTHHGIELTEMSQHTPSSSPTSVSGTCSTSRVDQYPSLYVSDDPLRSQRLDATVKESDCCLFCSHKGAGNEDELCGALRKGTSVVDRLQEENSTCSTGCRSEHLNKGFSGPLSAQLDQVAGHITDEKEYVREGQAADSNNENMRPLPSHRPPREDYSAESVALREPAEGDYSASLNPSLPFSQKVCTAQPIPDSNSSNHTKDFFQRPSPNPPEAYISPSFPTTTSGAPVPEPVTEQFPAEVRDPAAVGLVCEAEDPPKDPRLAQLGITAELCSRDLWLEFHEHGTEMIITKMGRRMFPTVKVRLHGLNSKDSYIVYMDMVPVDDKRYRYVYHSSEWTVAGPGDTFSFNNRYIHPDSPASGRLWQSQGIIAFDKLKLTNRRHSCTPAQISLHSMHKYRPRVHVQKTTDLLTSAEQQIDLSRSLTFTFPETEFITVTAYQNQEITRLKIASNPFAKGFRDLPAVKRPSSPGSEGKNGNSAAATQHASKKSRLTAAPGGQIWNYSFSLPATHPPLLCFDRFSQLSLLQSYQLQVRPHNLPFDKM